MRRLVLICVFALLMFASLTMCSLQTTVGRFSKDTALGFSAAPLILSLICLTINSQYLHYAIEYNI